MRKLARLLALSVALLPALAAAQVPLNSLPANTVVGRSAINAGPAQAIPFSQLISVLLQSSPFIPTVNVNSVIFRGATSGQATVQAQAVAGTPTLNLPTTSGTIPSTATAPIVLNATTGAISCPTCATSAGAAQPVVQSQAAAVALNLSGIGSIQTLGYAAAGDGGGATFKNIGTSPFTDSFVTAGSITSAGSGCTAGTYYEVSFTGGTGHGFKANVVATTSVTSVTIVNSGGNAYSVNDVLTGSITGCTFTWTVSTVSAPLASFSDNVGTHFQYVVSEGNFINARQFGVKADGTTDDTISLQAAIKYADQQFGTSCASGTLAGTCGNTVLLPVGATYLNSATLKVYDSVILRGQGAFNSNLVLGASFPAANDFINLCDPLIHVACFGVKLMDLTVSANSSIAANNNTWMISSVSAQQTTMLEHVAVYGGQRGCLHYTQAYGGAAKVDIYDFFCTGSNATLTDLVVLDPGGTTNISFNGGTIIEAGGSGYAGNAINWVSGNLFINGFHSEGIATPINAAASVSTYQATLEGASGGNGCTELVKLQSTNTPGNIRIGSSQLNGCTRLVTNGQAGGSNYATSVRGAIMCVSGACAAAVP